MKERKKIVCSRTFNSMSQRTTHRYTHLLYSTETVGTTFSANQASRLCNPNLELKRHRFSSFTHCICNNHTDTITVKDYYSTCPQILFCDLFSCTIQKYLINTSQHLIIMLSHPVILIMGCRNLLMESSVIRFHFYYLFTATQIGVKYHTLSTL